MEGIVKLYDAYGKELDIPEKTLVKLESRPRSIRFHRRTLKQPGTYWLVSARPGYVRMVLEINLDRGFKTGKWGLGWCVNGIASYPHWEVESSLKHFIDRPVPKGNNDDQFKSTRIPANVEELARQHVYYVPGVKGLSDVRSQFAVKTVTLEEAVRRLARKLHLSAGVVQELADSLTMEERKQLNELLDREVEIMELMLTVTFLCSKHPALDGKEMAMARALTKQQFKLFMLYRKLGAQLAQG